MHVIVLCKVQMDSSEKGGLSSVFYVCPGHTKVIHKCYYIVEQQREKVVSLSILLGLQFQATEQNLYLNNSAFIHQL